MTREIRVRNLLVLLLSAAAISLAGCGGGDDSGSTGSNTSSSTSGSITAAANVQPVTVDAGPANKSVNALYTSVTICAPGGASCQTIDHILVDTGSTGLRVMASALSGTLALPAQTDSGLNPLLECAQFADGSTWGAIRLADVRMAGEVASSVPVQIIGDSSFAAVPVDCPGTPKNSVELFGANGVLGVSVFQQDYGISSEQHSIPGTYYTCHLSGCQSVAVNLKKQVQNPVSMFAKNNNGMIIQLPSIPVAGARNVTGSLIFGIGTQDNNRIGAANIIPVNKNDGSFITHFNGVDYTAFIDSGTNGIFIPDPDQNISVVCQNKFYCPTDSLSLSVTNHGISNASSVVHFDVGNANSLLDDNPDFNAFTSLAGPNNFTGGFDFGLPFFYGRSVYTAIDGMNPDGPYVAY